MAVESWLLEILACPRCLSPLQDRGATLVCTATTTNGCGSAYPVRDGIPVLLVDEAIAGPADPAGVDGVSSSDDKDQA